jgi:TonB-dependent starch-binding outer membrane protein SusC
MKKIGIFGRVRENPPLTKWIRMMKLTCLLLTIALVQVSAETYSQTKKLTLNLKDAPLAVLFEEIEKTSEFNFFYDSSGLDLSRKVTVTVENSNIEEVLDVIFSDSDISYEIFDRYIIIKSKRSAIDGERFLTKQQQGLVSGKVTDSGGQPLPGVTVIIKGTTQGTVTNTDGNYSLTNIPEDATLVFSFVGMRTQEVEVGNQTTINVSMEVDAIGIDEVVAIGYGTMKRSSLTGSVAKLDNERLDNIPVGRTELAVIGQLPGLSIRQTRARPGDSPNISIRGTSSITGSNNPLIVIDGFPGGSLTSINSGDIESIEILKDASSAAIYGSRAAGGVILVTTKKGENQKPSFNFSTYYGIQNAINLHDDILNSEETYQYSLKRLNLQWIQDGGDPDVPISQRPLDYRPDERKRTLADTDWQKEMLRTGAIQNYELSARGGSDLLNFYVSGNYMDEKGVFIVGSFKRYSIRANFNTQFSDKFEMGLNLYGARTDQRRNDMRMREAIKYPPYIPVYLPEGETAPDGSNYAYNRYYFNDNTSQVNPVAKTLGEYNNYYRYSTMANSYLKYSIVNGLDIKSSLGINYGNTKNPFFRTTYAHKNAQVVADFSYNDNINLLNENMLTYTKLFNDIHNFDFLLGSSFQKQKNFGANIEVIDGSIPDNRIQTLNVGVISDGSTSESEWGLISYFGRINYSYADKYLLSAAYRTDGSSRFGKDKKWGTFPSLSLGWRIDQENFMQSSTKISAMKIRASYGLTGRVPGGLYDPIPRINNYGYTLGSGNGTLVNGATQGSFGNTELGWEKTKEFNIGLDLGLANNRIQLNTDVYQRVTTDLLLANPIPAVTGFSSTTTNIGQISNKGLELALNTRNLNGKFSWETKLNYSRNLNIVDDLGGLESLPLSKAGKGMWFQTKVGEPIGQYYGWVTDGIWINQEEIDSNPHYPGAEPGSIRVKDMNGDGEIDTDDRAILGSYMPDFEFGITNEFRYNNFDLMVLINGVIGFEIYNYEVNYYRSTRKIFTQNQWFSPEEPGDGKTPGSGKGVDIGSTDYYIQDGSYWGVRNIILGYTFPKSIMNNVFNSARVYLSVQNAFLLTSKEFTAYNPEGFTDNTGRLTTRGVNYGSEPVNRTISFGLNLNF